MCDHEIEDFPCDDLEARALGSSKSLRPRHITRTLRLSGLHTRTRLSTATRVQARAVSLCLTASAHRIMYTPLKTRERSQRSVPGTSYLELKNSTNRAYSRARPIRSPSIFLFSFSLPAGTKVDRFTSDEKTRELERIRERGRKKNLLLYR